mmetsp:Transcript_80637/g.231526  ORF Transcript_80637/g.231526 Transcript_80637/m.231526 type:complete len:319 (+) Transcript_80637:74-1030(+)
MIRVDSSSASLRLAQPPQSQVFFGQAEGFLRPSSRGSLPSLYPSLERRAASPARIGGLSRKSSSSALSAFVSCSLLGGGGCGSGGASSSTTAASLTSLGAAGTWSLKSALGGSSSSGPSGGSSGGGCFALLAERSRLQAERCARLTVSVEAEFDIAVFASLESGQVDGSDLPLVISAGKPCSVCYVGDAEGIVGSLVLEGFRDSVPFHVRPGTGHLPADCFIGRRGKLRDVVIERTEPSSCHSPTAPALPAAAGAQGAAGAVVELRMLEGCPASLSIHIRRAQEMEVRRLEARREAACLQDGSPHAHAEFGSRRRQTP